MNRVNRHVTSVMRAFYKITLCYHLAFGIMSLLLKTLQESLSLLSHLDMICQWVSK